MKLLPSQPDRFSRRVRELAFTFTELMVSMSVLMLILAGILLAHLNGMRLFQITKAKLEASDDARIAITKLVSDIRSAKIVRIGNGSLTTFAQAADGSAQQGNAIQLYPSTNTNYFLRYYFDNSDKKLKRTTNGVTVNDIIANSISNNIIFTSEKYNGTVLTESENNRVIGLTLRFYQLQYPIIPIVPGGLFDYYQLRTRITRRTLE